MGRGRQSAEVRTGKVWGWGAGWGASRGRQPQGLLGAAGAHTESSLLVGGLWGDVLSARRSATPQSGAHPRWALARPGRGERAGSPCEHSPFRDQAKAGPRRPQGQHASTMVSQDQAYTAPGGPDLTQGPLHPKPLHEPGFQAPPPYPDLGTPHLGKLRLGVGSDQRRLCPSLPSSSCPLPKGHVGGKPLGVASPGPLSPGPGRPACRGRRR